MPSSNCAVEAANETLRTDCVGAGVAPTGAGEEMAPIGAGAGCIAIWKCGTAGGGATVVRTLASGTSTAAVSAATHTTCRCRAGASGINRHTIHATPYATGACQMAFKRNVSAARLTVSMSFLPAFRDHLLNARQLLRRQMPRLHQTHHQAVRRS